MPDAFQSPENPVRSAKTAVGIAIAAIIGSLVVGWFAYLSSRQATLDSVARESLSVARSIANHVEREIAKPEGQAYDRQRIFEAVAETWRRTDFSYPESYLCAIESNGRLALHTKNPEMHGTDVSSLIVDPKSSQPRTVLELLSAKESLATKNSSFRGKPQLAGYAYMPALDSLVVVHVPASQVTADIRKAVIPWSLALALIVGVLFPLSLGLIHQNHLKSQRDVYQTSNALRQSEKQFRAIFEQAAIGVARMSSQTGQFLEINQRYCDMLGYSREEMSHTSFQDITHPDELQDNVNKLTDLHAGTIREFTMEKRYVRKDGSTLWVNLTVLPMWQPGEEPTSHILIVEDITDRKHAEAGIRLRDRALASISNGLVISDATQNDMPVIYCNPAFERLTGYNRDEVIGRNCSFLQGDDRDQPGRVAIRKAIRNGQEVTTTLRNYRKDGTMFWAEVQISPVYDTGGKLTHFLGFQTDVTERKQAEKALRESEARYADLYENAPQMMWSFDPETATVVQCNQTMADVLGTPKEEIKGSPIFDFIAPRSLERVRSRLLPTFISTGRVKNEELTLRCADGTTRDVILNSTAVRDKSGTILYSRSMFKDITEQKEADRELRFTKFSVDTCSSMIFWIRSDASFSYVNDAAIEHFGYTREQWLTMSVPDTDPSYPREAWPEFWKNMQKARTLTFETRIQHKNGKLVPVTITTNILEFEDEEFLFAFVTDISDRTAAEERLREREFQLAHVSRLSSLGEMTAGIAHEIKQPLHAVANFATATAVALRDVAGNPNLERDWAAELIEWNRGINKASLRASEIVERLRGFARKSDQPRESQSVAGLLRESVELISFEARQSQVNVQIQVPEDIPNVLCDRIQIQQVIVNLLHNAYDALAETHGRERKINLIAIQDGDQIEIEVSDNGPGFAEDFQGNIFEAFFTTKKNGMGMGLAISQTIIEDHGGRLKAVSNEQGGGTFCFKLPIAIEHKKLREEHVNDR